MFNKYKLILLSDSHHHLKNNKIIPLRNFISKIRIIIILQRTQILSYSQVKMYLEQNLNCKWYLHILIQLRMKYQPIK